MGEAGDLEQRRASCRHRTAASRDRSRCDAADRQQADAVPVVEPTVDERQLRRFSLNENRSEWVSASLMTYSIP